MRLLRSAIALAGFFALTLAVCGKVNAQPNYPHAPIRLVVPFSAGGGNDIAARLLAKTLAEKLATSIIVENRPGAGGNIGMSSVARSAPDGYTLVYVANTVVINPYLYKGLNFDISTDFEPVGVVATTPVWILTHPALPVKSVSELIAYGKDNPGRLSYATPGVGTPHHMAAELFNAKSPIDWVHIPYKGASGAATDVVGGQAPVLIATPASVKEFVATGKLRPIATMDARRSPTQPALATVAETIPGYDVSIWHGIMAPAKTDPAIIAKLSDALKQALQDPELSAQLSAVGFSPAFSTADQMQQRITDDLDVWSNVAKQAGIVAE